LTGAKLVQVASAAHLQKWLKAHSTSLSLDDHFLVCIISDQFRHLDGGEVAGERLCQYLKHGQSPWRELPFLLYYNSVDGVDPQLKTEKKRGIFVSKDPDVLLAFIEGKPIKK
jgi:hypothetical protein